MARTIVVLLILLVLMPLVGAYQPSESECVSGGGSWTQLEDKGFCSCGSGLGWNQSSLNCEDHREELCLKTGGSWISGKGCDCAEWNNDYGCEIPLVSITEEEPQNYSVIDYLLAFLVILSAVYVLWRAIR